MSRRVKEFVDVADHVSIDDLIHKLSEIRDGLPQGADAELETFLKEWAGKHPYDPRKGMRS